VVSNRENEGQTKNKPNSKTMPIGAVTAGLIGAGAQAGANIGSTILTNRANRRLAEYQWNKNVEMWHMQNEYNAPKQQVTRLKEAGLNPNLVYGKGTSTGNQSAQAPTYQAPTMQAPQVAIGNVLGEFQNLELRQAQIDNVKAQTARTNQATANDAIRELILGTDYKYKGYSLRQKRWETEGDGGTFNIKQNDGTYIRNSSPYQADFIQNFLDRDQSINIKRLQGQNLQALTAGVEKDNQWKEFKNLYAKYGINIDKDDISSRLTFLIMKRNGMADKSAGVILGAQILKQLTDFGLKGYGIKNFGKGFTTKKK
jgi:hypothetical protein